MAVGNLKSMLGLNGNDNMGGLIQSWYYAPIADFSVIKGLKGISATPGDAVTIDGAHEFSAGKGFILNYCSKNTGKVKYSSVGEVDNETLSVEGEFYLPGNNVSAAETAYALKNTEVILMVKYATGEVEQIGTELLPVKVTSEYDSGENGAGKKGWTFKFKTFQQCKQFYASADLLSGTVVA